MHLELCSEFRGGRWYLGWLLGLACLGGVVAARAEGAVRAIELSWSAPSDCPDQTRVESSVQRLLATSRATQTRPVPFSGMVKRIESTEGAVWRLNLSTQDGKQRALEAGNCEVLVDMAALSMALAIDPTLEVHAEQAATPTTGTSPPVAVEPATSEATTTQVSPTQPPAATPTAPATSRTPVAAAGFVHPGPIDAPPAPASLARSSSGAQWGAMLGASLDAGLLSSTGVGVTAGGLLVIEKATRVHLGGVLFPAHELSSDENASSGANVSLYAAQLGACRALPWRVARLALCASLEGGALHARGFGVDRPKRELNSWWAGELGLLASGELGESLLLHARGGLVVPFTRYDFIVDREVVGEIPRLAGRFAVGVEFLPE